MDTDNGVVEAKGGVAELGGGGEKGAICNGAKKVIKKEMRCLVALFPDGKSPQLALAHKKFLRQTVAGWLTKLPPCSLTKFFFSHSAGRPRSCGHESDPSVLWVLK